VSSLVRFGRRQAVRLHSLTSRQAIGLGAMAVVCLGVAIASATGHAAVATSALALLLAATLSALVLLARRMRALHRADRAALGDLRIVVEQVQRRLVAAVEKERLAAGDRHQELLDAIARAERLTPDAADGLLREQNREIEALVQLFQTVTPRAPMPADGGPRPTDLLGLLHTVRARNPKLVVALGANPATIWLGYALESAARLVVVEHDAEHADRTRALLASHGLGGVEVVHAPLAELTLEARTVDWYDVDALDGLHDIDVLVVTGPATADAVPPALHVLGRRLAPGAAVVVEEAARVAPRQLGFDGLVPERRLAGRYTALAMATS
jgi:predicted O-methyltransferase YrrM